jgi:hypothetical protein
MADEDARTTLDVPQVSISNNEAPSTQQSQGQGTPQRDVVMADVPTDQAVRPVHVLLPHEISFLLVTLLRALLID